MTATATATELTSEQVIELERRRRELATRVEDARQDRGRIQAKLKALGSNLEDTNIIEHIGHLQGLLQESTALCGEAEKALQAFDAENPSDAELNRRASAIAAEKARLAREAARQPFLENRKEAIQLLERSLALDRRAVELVNEAPAGTWNNAMEASSIADLTRNWPGFNSRSDGLLNIHKSLAKV